MSPTSTSVTIDAIGRLQHGPGDHVEGYKVILIDGSRVGRVVDSSESGLVVRIGSWPRRRIRTLPIGEAVIRDVDRTVLMLAPPHTLEPVQVAATPEPVVPRKGRPEGTS